MLIIEKEGNLGVFILFYFVPGSQTSQSRRRSQIRIVFRSFVATSKLNKRDANARSHALTAYYGLRVSEGRPSDFPRRKFTIQ